MLDAWKTFPVFNLAALVLGERLGHFLSVLGEPVTLRILLLQLELLLDTLVDLFLLCRLELANQLTEVLKLLLHEELAFK